MALSPIHNQWLLRIATNAKGEPVFFLPQIGYALVVLGAGFFLVNHWDEVREKGTGDRRVFIPLLVIAGAIGLSGIGSQGNLLSRLAPLFMGLAWIALYLSSRVLGKSLFTSVAIGSAVASVGVIVSAILEPGRVTGGLVFGTNYDIVVGYVLLGSALLIEGRWRLPLVSLALVALFLSGSPEALFALGVVSIVVLVRKDLGWKTVASLAPVVIVITIWFGVGWGQTLYGYAGRVALAEPTVNYPPPIPATEPQTAPYYDEPPSKIGAIDYRTRIARSALSSIKPWGTGYSITKFDRSIVHDVPLVIVQQLGWPGVLASLSWVWVTVWLLARTKWKYAWASLLALSVFDHYVWTQLAPYFWAIAGVSSTSPILTDLMFRRRE